VDPTDRFTELVTSSTGEVPLDEAALLIAAHAHPGLTVETGLVALDALATSAEASSPTELATFLFVSERFSGNTADYADPRNSYLDDVLERRLGIPITLSVLMIEVGRRCGIELHGVGMPGHFLVGDGYGAWYDPFYAGARLDEAACAARFAELQPAAPFDRRMLDPTPSRRIVDRMLANLQRSFLAREPASAAWVLRLRLRMPDLTAVQRGELAAVLGRVGHFSEAARELDEAARGLPPEPADHATRAAARLRARAN
jgi:regulator of sirC expression with transglutaminase-like and TPR domain